MNPNPRRLVRILLPHAETLRFHFLFGKLSRIRGSVVAMEFNEQRVRPIEILELIEEDVDD